VRRLVGLTGHDLSPQRGIGRQDVMEANEMEPRAGDERGEALEEFQRGQHQMGRARTGRLMILITKPQHYFFDQF